MENNITKENLTLTKKKKEAQKNQSAITIWLTGLSGSGKSTIANLLEIELYKMGYHTSILDGDNLRLGLNNNLGFKDEDRSENIRRTSEVCKLLNDAGIIVIASLISPYNKDRSLVKEIIGEDNFILFYIDTDLDVCEKRDSKGLYKKARSGEINNFTGISSPFEIPTNAILLKNNDIGDLDNNIKTIINNINNRIDGNK